MSLMKMKDIRAMSVSERQDRLRDLKEDLMHERGIAAMGGAPASPGKVRALRTNIARILTHESEIRNKQVPNAKSE